jgi:hypothetical protein
VVKKVTVRQGEQMMMESNPVGMSLDDMIYQEHSHRKNYKRAANPDELKQTIEKFKQRSERFANDEEAGQRLQKLNRMEKKL